MRNDEHLGLLFFFCVSLDAASADLSFKSFSNRLQFLQGLLEEDLDLSDDFRDMGRDLRRRLDGLKESLSLEDRLSCGGKFEWVDSMLVKVSLFCVTLT